MVRQEFRFPSADGKTAIHAVEWLPDGEPAAVLQISHGVSEYILRYEPLASFFAQRGIAVVGHDHLGHGDSVADGAPRLYFGPAGSWDWVVQDLETRRKLARKQFPDVPYFLLGHSMGSFLARTYLIRYPGTVDAGILSGTGQMTSPVLAAGKLIAAREAQKVDRTQSSPVVMRLAFDAYNKRFAPNRTGFDWLSVSMENVDAYILDPLCGGNPTIGLFQEMLEGLTFLAKPQHLRQMNLNTPALFVSGEMDPVGECGKGVRRVYNSFRQAGVRDVTLRLYPNLRHEIFYEDCSDAIYQDLYQWLAARFPLIQKAQVQP